MDLYQLIAIFRLFFFVFLLAFVIGMAKPSMVFPWGNSFVKKKRIIISIYGGGSFAAALSIIALAMNATVLLLGIWAVWFFLVWLACTHIKTQGYIKNELDKSGFVATRCLEQGVFYIAVDDYRKRTCVLTMLLPGWDKQIIENFAPSRIRREPGALVAIDDSARITGYITLKRPEVFINVAREFVPVEEYHAPGIIVAVDTSTYKVTIWQQGTVPKTFTAKDILSVEIMENFNTISKTDRKSQLAGAIVGKLIDGDVGEIIGGLSGDIVTGRLVKEISIRIIVDDIAAPNYMINFLNVETTNSSEYYRKAVALAQKWYGLLKVIMHQNKLTAGE